MRKLVRPNAWGAASFVLAATLVVGAGLGSDYASTFTAEQSRLNARVGALENRPTPPAQVTVSPSPAEPSPSPSQSPDTEPPATSGNGSLVAASGGREPVSRSPRDLATGGSPPDSDPPSAAPPSESSDSCPAGSGLLSLCVKASLLSTPEPAE